MDAMEIRQLKTFLHVAELGSVSKASQRLRIAQPALSRQLRLLEEELKVALFTRDGRGMVLTHAGETLRDRASGILRQLEETKLELASESAVLRGRVAFGMPPSVAEALAGRLIEGFLAEHPEVSLRFVTASSGYLLDWLHGGEIDVAILHAGEVAASIEVSPLLVEDLFLITAADDPGAARPSTDFAEVAQRRLLLSGPHQGLRLLLEKEARRQGLDLDILLEADALPVLKRLVAKGTGATILPMAAVRQEVKAGTLAAIPFTPRLTRGLVMAQALGRPVSDAAQRFCARLRREVTEMVEAQLW